MERAMSEWQDHLDMRESVNYEAEAVREKLAAERKAHAATTGQLERLRASVKTLRCAISGRLEAGHPSVSKEQHLADLLKWVESIEATDDPAA